ncbi:hypothetical protein CcI156_01100 [Frankia sp. CcI156]|uniref:DUF1416 domain-containing protein n=1 Tax=Frankia casuarinae (strain DSM 45818 / CECT 9043 / HFP020203 / CcI3) TaxID=106370 RepID=Q2JFV6_FRACC|nr:MULTISPECIES: DUF1416 domain-containing protein [Frankia]ABD09836.1 protein of unknown function DUF1416 [Frankia casuarinae]OFB41468.1 hypothetical protein Manayef4_02530 [Frankia sp. CgIM4]OHV50859.1 hypothetical protein CgIS1_04245 [Frankia sp. CgIS1]ONH30107.1 hypothetical protein CcI156_01100 [Frankia sp. CcI156]ORT53202.1 hypothetical protein KBI5_07790 [Frankia sp. KB5]
MCGAISGGPSVEGIDVAKETVIQGVVVQGGEPVSTGYARLLDEGGDFTAEVPLSATGQFRFFARPGQWTVRALVPGATGERKVVARQGEPVDTQVEVAA